MELRNGMQRAGWAFGRSAMVGLTGVFLVFLAMVLLQACKHEPPAQPELPGGGNGGGGQDCDPGVIYFQQQILPIFIAHCAECHSGPDPEDDIDLTSYANIMDGDDIVRPYDLNRKLFRRITDDDLDDRMPLNRPPLSQQQIDLIRDWIMQGALNTSCVDAVACDTLNVTWSGTIRPRIISNCQGCHNSPQSTSGLDLTNWTVANQVALDGRLLGSVRHQQGFISMPPAGQMLPACNIREFEIWVAAGAPNN